MHGRAEVATQHVAHKRPEPPRMPHHPRQHVPRKGPLLAPGPAQQCPDEHTPRYALEDTIRALPQLPGRQVHAQIRLRRRAVVMGRLRIDPALAHRLLVQHRARHRRQRIARHHLQLHALQQIDRRLHVLVRLVDAVHHREGAHPDPVPVRQLHRPPMVLHRRPLLVIVQHPLRPGLDAKRDLDAARRLERRHRPLRHEGRPRQARKLQPELPLAQALAELQHPLLVADKHIVLNLERLQPIGTRLELQIIQHRAQLPETHAAAEQAVPAKDAAPRTPARRHQPTGPIVMPRNSQAHVHIRLVIHQRVVQSRDDGHIHRRRHPNRHLVDSVLAIGQSADRSQIGSLLQPPHQLHHQPLAFADADEISARIQKFRRIQRGVAPATNHLAAHPRFDQRAQDRQRPPPLERVAADANQIRSELPDALHFAAQSARIRLLVQPAETLEQLDLVPFRPQSRPDVHQRERRRPVARGGYQSHSHGRSMPDPFTAETLSPAPAPSPDNARSADAPETC